MHSFYRGVHELPYHPHMSRRSLALLIAVTMSTPLLLAQTPVRPATQTGAAAAPAAPDVLYRRATEAWEAGA